MKTRILPYVMKLMRNVTCKVTASVSLFFKKKVAQHILDVLKI